MRITKKEALEIYFNGIGEKSKVERVQDVIDAIYNETCDNCKYNTDSSLCSAGIVYDNYTVDDTFGCCKFEAEDG